ncbi:transcription factor bHLH112-like isoform X1 [Cucurbita moschata]|uniref:Transcription factor bHLH112-like isoform X1 n=1 Tax=Cucurbita moschata TaxID=3662 RepID=A0A6J1GF19_CUCMO|nr:transcription factor bHLH112-like isoform X1 [Cucurbita moschata]
MAEDFQAAICGDNWWSSSRTMLVAVGGLSPCSMGIGDLAWPPADDFSDIKPKSTANYSDNQNSMFFQDYSTSDHWNQPHDLLLKRGDYLLEQNGVNCMNCCSSTSQGLFPLDSALYGYPSPSTKLLHGLYNNDNDDDDDHPDPHSLFNAATTPINTNYPSNYLIKPSLPIPPPSQPVSPALHFTNNTPFWNASHAPPSIEIPQNSRLGFKAMNNGNCEDGEEARKGDKNEPPVLKRPRIETPSPLPTFKVRKEKLGDRVTALQQLVSPFGKTDTASVLHEAIEYIKFLHDQVSLLSTPYMKNNNGITPVQQQQVSEKADPKQDLKSRGLCLVPISSTFPVTNATTADFWSPTFGGTFR